MRLGRQLLIFSDVVVAVGDELGDLLPQPDRVGDALGTCLWFDRDLHAISWRATVEDQHHVRQDPAHDLGVVFEIAAVEAQADPALELLDVSVDRQRLLGHDDRDYGTCQAHTEEGKRLLEVGE